MNRQDVMSILESLPDDTPFDKIADEIEKVCFMASVQRGLDQLDKGEKTPHFEVKKKIAAWPDR